MSAEMAKAMGGELEAVQQQTQAAQARVTEAQAALQQRTEELEAGGRRLSPLALPLPPPSSSSP